MIAALHTLVHIVGTLAGLLVVVLVHQYTYQKRRRPRIDHAPHEEPVPAWTLPKDQVELWLEARMAVERAEEAEDPPAYD